MRFFIVAAVLPAVALMFYIYRMDRAEKEPPGLLCLLAALGALACLPAAGLEKLLGNILGHLVVPQSMLYFALYAFLVVGLSEEGCKYFLLYRATWRHPAFNYRFDGIVYAVFVSLGFAALENILYVFRYGPDVLLSRAIFSIPGHMTFGVFMGVFYSHARLCLAYQSGRGVRHYQRLALFVPLLLHGFFDFCLFIDLHWLSLLFLVFVLALDISAFLLIRRQSHTDRPFPHQSRPPV